jgi:hypothetical protein
LLDSINRSCVGLVKGARLLRTEPVNKCPEVMGQSVVTMAAIAPGGFADNTARLEHNDRSPFASQRQSS